MCVVRMYQEWAADNSAARRVICPKHHMHHKYKLCSLSFQGVISDFAHKKSRKRVLIFKLICSANTVHLSYSHLCVTVPVQWIQLYCITTLLLLPACLPARPSCMTHHQVVLDFPGVRQVLLDNINKINITVIGGAKNALPAHTHIHTTLSLSLCLSTIRMKFTQRSSSSGSSKIYFWMFPFSSLVWGFIL
jgi:hypothetical protein